MISIFNHLYHCESRRRARRGQTALEYALMLMVVVLPMAAAFREMLKDDDQKKQSNLIKKIVKDAYGEGNDMGVIGRPYP